MRSRLFNLFIVPALLLSLLGSAVTVTPARAASFTASNVTELISAINSANSSANADTITLTADISLIASNNIGIAGPNGLPVILGVGGSLTIEGGGYTISRTGGSPDFRFFDNNGNLTISNVTLSNGKSPSNGGAIFNSGTLTISNSILSGNSAAGNGGGISNNGSGSLTINASTISDNTAISWGGGIYNQGTLNIQNGSVIGGDTVGEANTASDGGGVYNIGGTATIDASTVSGNLATNHGGGIRNEGTLNVQNGSVIGGDTASEANTAINGGGIYHIIGTANISNSTISGNSATSSGGGIYNAATITMTNSTLSGNSATNGGGITNIYPGTLAVTNSTLSNNSATTTGGAIGNTGTLTVTNTTLSGNSATNGDGGGIHNINLNPTLTDVTFSGNSAPAGSGGGMYNNSSAPTLTNVTFNSNSASNGGGMDNSSTTPTLTNVTFSGNSATSNGGGMRNSTSSPQLTNVTFSGNSAITGGGMDNSFSVPMLTNVILANSTGSNCSGSLSANSKNNLINDISCGLTDGTNSNKIGASYNVNLELLANNGGFTQTHALLTGSDAIDAGANCAATDQRGVTRPQGAGCDIGAYEFGAVIPMVTASNPAAKVTLASLSAITVVFNQDMLDNATANGAENVDNYLLVEHGANGFSDTVSCAGGVVSDDVPQTINTASYSNAGGVYISTLTFNSLTAGTYRLFVCGTTSIWSVAGLELNNGTDDYRMDFTIAPATGTGTTSAETTNTRASSLPKTGFAPNKITSLPAQPANLEYTNLGDLWLEIPSLNVKTSIVGVPQNEDKSWDVSWLGNDTGWLNGTAFPTWNGNSVLTAHVTNANGLEGPFAALKNLKYGDQVIVHMGGAQYVYEIRNTRLARPYSTGFAFESLQDHSYLTLITCQGFNPLSESYLFRKIVRAVLVDVK